MLALASGLHPSSRVHHTYPPPTPGNDKSSPTPGVKDDRIIHLLIHPGTHRTATRSGAASCRNSTSARLTATRINSRIKFGSNKSLEHHTVIATALRPGAARWMLLSAESSSADSPEPTSAYPGILVSWGPTGTTPGCNKQATPR